MTHIRSIHPNDLYQMLFYSDFYDPCVQSFSLSSTSISNTRPDEISRELEPLVDDFIVGGEEFRVLIDSGEVTHDKKMSRSNLPRVVHHQVCTVL